MLRIFTFLLAIGVCAPVFAQSGADNAEARGHFERGNAALERARRARGARQRRHLESALSAYVETLAIVRSRNALFNAGLVLEQLQRGAEAFAYFQEYMRIPGLSDVERAEGQTHLDALRPSLALVTIQSDPPGATVFVDRVDLAARGVTPLELAVQPGSHRIFFRLAHHVSAEQEFDGAVGEQRNVSITLEAESVEVIFEVAGGEGARLELDGAPIDGMRQSVAPGPHVARLISPTRTPVERRFLVRPGEPLRVRLDAATAAALNGSITVLSEEGAMVSVDGLHIGEGAEVVHETRPGPHNVRVEAPGRAPYEQMVSVSEGRTVRVRVALAEEARRPLGPLPHIALGLTGAAAIGFGVLAVSARSDNNAFEDACPGSPRDQCENLAGDVDRANARADILLGLTGALAITTVLFYVFNRKRSAESSGEVDLVAGREGSSLSYRRSF